MIDASSWRQVELHLLTGDATDPTSRTLAMAVSESFDLVVIDLGGEPARSLGALWTWAELVAEGGIVVVEDLWGAGDDDSSTLEALDRFLLAHREFGLCERGARHPLVKGVGLRRGC